MLLLQFVGGNPEIHVELNAYTQSVNMTNLFKVNHMLFQVIHNFEQMSLRPVILRLKLLSQHHTFLYIRSHFADGFIQSSHDVSGRSMHGKMV